MAQNSRRKGGRRARRGGKATERYWCKKLDDILPEFGPYARQLGELGRQNHGDIVRVDSEPYTFPIYIESKHRLRFSHSQLCPWVDEIDKRANEYKKVKLILVQTSNNVPLMFSEGDWHELGLDESRIRRRCYEHGVVYVPYFPRPDEGDGTGDAPGSE